MPRVEVVKYRRRSGRPLSLSDATEDGRRRFVKRHRQPRRPLPAIRMKRAEGVEFSYYLVRQTYTAKRFYLLLALIQVFEFLLHVALLSQQILSPC